MMALAAVVLRMTRISPTTEGHDNERGSMSETAQFSIGAEVVCEDGTCGDLRRVVVDPVARAVTHLVVEPKHRRRLGHLVPIDLVDTSGQAIRLRCTKAAFEALENAEETHFLPGAYGEWGYGQD